MWSQVLRFVGFTALGELARRLPLGLNWAIGVAMMVISGLIPLWLVHAGRWSTKDLMLLYAIETFVVVFDALVRILTFQSRWRTNGIIRWGPWMTGNALLAWIYFFVIALMVPALPIIAVVNISNQGGLLGGTGSWLLGTGLILLSVGLSVGVQWFALGQRWHTHRIWPTVAMASTKMALVYVVVIMLGTRPPSTELPTAVLVLVLVKIGCDLLVATLDLISRLRPPKPHSPRKPGFWSAAMEFVEE